MVEGGGLENRCTQKVPGGSNPSPSASVFKGLRGLNRCFSEDEKRQLSPKLSPPRGNYSVATPHNQTEEAGATLGNQVGVVILALWLARCSGRRPHWEFFHSSSSRRNCCGGSLSPTAV